MDNSIYPTVMTATNQQKKTKNRIWNEFPGYSQKGKGVHTRSPSAHSYPVRRPASTQLFRRMGSITGYRLLTKSLDRYP